MNDQQNAMMLHSGIGINEQIACVERELKMRRRVYERRVADKKMTQHLADWEIACMEAVRDTLVAKANSDVFALSA